MLHFIDQKWMEHLRGMDELREGIGLRAYAQKEPLLEYKFEAYQMFQGMMADIDEDVVGNPLPHPGGDQGGAARAAEEARRRRRPGSARRRPTGSPDGARRRRGRAAAGRRQGGAERSVSLRQREEVQEVPRRASFLDRNSWRGRVRGRDRQTLRSERKLADSGRRIDEMGVYL